MTGWGTGEREQIGIIALHPLGLPDYPSPRETAHTSAQRCNDEEHYRHSSAARLLGHVPTGIRRSHTSFGATMPHRPSRGALYRRHREVGRSEEHTSELQSLMRISYAVFCLKQKD